MKSPTTIVRRISEQIIPAWSWGWLPFSGLRSSFGVLASKFWGNRPAFDNTIVSYDKARQLYRNDGTENDLGAGFCKPIIDLQVNFIGLPVASTEDPDLDDFLNNCMHTYWASAIQQMLRNSMRDSKTIMRLRQPDLNDPLMTLEERSYGCLETVDPERVVLVYRPGNANVIDEAYITHKILIFDAEGDIINGIMPKEREHEVVEVITAENFRYYDRTDRVWLDNMAMPNNWGIIPLVEAWNEYDSSLSGGQSDLESVLPFIRAFHDVTAQGLQAHKYHSVPKVKFKLKEIGTFIKNNFPDAWDETTGRIKPQATVSWTGREVIFLQEDEDAEFIEAISVLGDTRELAGFLIDCICVASETPRWAFMLVDAGSANQANNAQSLPFSKKIERKRRNFSHPVQTLLKMVQFVNGYQITIPKISWETQEVEALAAESQAFQQFIMGLEVAAQRQIISDETYRAEVRRFLPSMKNPAQEAEDAKDNFDPAAADALLATNTPQDQAPASSNGHGKKSRIAITAGKQGKNE